MCKRRITIVSIYLSILFVVMLCPQSCSTHNGNGPGPSSWRFAAALRHGDFSAAAAETTDSIAAKSAISKIYSALHATGVDLKIGQVHTSGTLSTVDYEYIWSLPNDAHFTYHGNFNYINRGSIWQMLWSNRSIYPILGDGQSLIYSSIVPSPSALNSIAGNPLIVPTVDKRVEFRALQVGDSEAALGICQQLANIFSHNDPQISAQDIYDVSMRDGMAVVTQLPEKVMQTIPHALEIVALPGVKINDIASWRAVDSHLLPSIAPNLEKYIIEHQIGTSGWSVRIIDADGNEVRMVEYHPPRDVTSVTTTLHTDIQQAAQRAVNRKRDRAAIIVAIQPSTGNILAIAQNARADKSGLLATMGLYPPGSTFKIITAGAAIENHLADVDSIVPCPGVITIGNRVIPNFNRFSLGNVTLREAFAQSCNTSFADLAAKMSPMTLPQTAAWLGLGVDYVIPAIYSVTGKVIPSPRLAERTEDGFGQGRDLASPLGLAIVAASVAHGAVIVPQLIMGDSTKVNQYPNGIQSGFLSRKTIEKLRVMMRAVVMDGTAYMLNNAGQVYGKTGEAEYGQGSHAWFVGYRGDLAFATLVVSGGGSNSAVKVTSDFLNHI